MAAINFNNHTQFHCNYPKMKDIPKIININPWDFMKTRVDEFGILTHYKEDLTHGLSLIARQQRREEVLFLHMP